MSTPFPDTQPPGTVVISFDGKRMIVIRPSNEFPEVLVAYSSPVIDFDLRSVQSKVGWLETDKVVILNEAAKPTEQLLESFPNAIVRQFIDEAMHFVISTHQNYSGEQFLYSVINRPPTISSYHRRAIDRIGNHGYALLGGASTFAGGKAAYRLAVKTYREHKALEVAPNSRDSLVQQLVAWNLVSQAYVSLETFSALFAAMKSANKDGFNKFESAYLRFGRTEKNVRADGIMQIMNIILAKDGPRTLAKLLHIPLHRKNIEDYGLSGLDIEETALVAVGQHSLDTVMRHLRRLASDFIEIDPVTRVASKTTPVEAYGAFRHGFKISFPLHNPQMFLDSSEVRCFANQTEFIKYKRKMQTIGELMYLGEPDAAGNDHVIQISGPAKTEDLKQFVQMVFNTGVWISEFAQYAISLYGSQDGRYPYLIDYTTMLGPDKARILKSRLDELLR